MKAQIVKRLQALEQVASRQAVRPIVLVEVLEMSDADREAYWAGDSGVLRRYGAPDPGDCPPGQVHTIVIDVHPIYRNSCAMAAGREDEADDEA